MDKRRRNARPSKYKPRTEAQKQRRKELWETRTQEREDRSRRTAEAELKSRLEELETALRDQGRGGVHGRRHTRPLDSITDDAERFGVLKARVERLEALWAVDRRKRDTRGKIIIGGAILAEMIDAVAAGDRQLFSAVLDVIDRRVEAVRDRLTVRDLLGGAPLPLRPGAEVGETVEDALLAAGSVVPDFDAMAHEAMAEATPLRPSQVDPDDAEPDEAWAPGP